jgi:hypothetical protein
MKQLVKDAYDREALLSMLALTLAKLDLGETMVIHVQPDCRYPSGSTAVKLRDFLSMAEIDPVDVLDLVETVFSDECYPLPGEEENPSYLRRLKLARRNAEA